MLLMHALFPVTVPFYLFWGLINWLVNKTACPIQWPKEIIDAVGEDVAGKMSNKIGQ